MSYYLESSSTFLNQFSLLLTARQLEGQSPPPCCVMVSSAVTGGTPQSSVFIVAGIIASEKATFHANFKQLAVSAEGCSTVHFERIIGAEAADKMLKQGIKIEAEEALKIGNIALVSGGSLDYNSFIRFYTRAGAAFRAIEKITRDRRAVGGGGEEKNNSRKSKH